VEPIGVRLSGPAPEFKAGQAPDSGISWNSCFPEADRPFSTEFPSPLHPQRPLSSLSIKVFLENSDIFNRKSALFVTR
jgi:hypothetical protein